MTNHDEPDQSLGGDSTAVVTVRSLTKRFGDIVAVDDLSFLHLLEALLEERRSGR